MKVLIKMTYDMGNEEFVYGTRVLEKEKWEKYKNIVLKSKVVFKTDVGKEKELPSKHFLDKCIQVTEITDKEAEVLEKLGFDSYGTLFPAVYIDLEDTNEI